MHVLCKKITKESTTTTTRCNENLLAWWEHYMESEEWPHFMVYARDSCNVFVVVVVTMFECVRIWFLRANENILSFSKIVNGSHPEHTCTAAAKTTTKNASKSYWNMLRTCIRVFLLQLMETAVTVSTTFLCVCQLHWVANAVHAPIGCLGAVPFPFLRSIQASVCAALLKIAYRYHRIEFTVFFRNVKAFIECFSVNALSLLLLPVVFRSSHLSILVRLLSSA